MNDLLLLILALAGLTYFTRISGYLVLLYFKALHPRVEAALEAVPAAVLATLIFPPAFTKGPLEAVTMILAFLLCLRVNSILVLILSLGFLVGLRTIIPM